MGYKMYPITELQIDLNQDFDLKSVLQKSKRLISTKINIYFFNVMASENINKIKNILSYI